MRMREPAEYGNDDVPIPDPLAVARGHILQVAANATANPKISRAKAHVRFSRYRAAQEAAPGGKLDLND